MNKTEALLTEYTEALADSFADIVKVAKIQDKDKFKIAQESYQTETRASNIVRQAEGLLTLVADLKQSLLVNDTQTLLQITASRKQTLTQQKNDIKRSVAELRDNLDNAIWELERVYYESPYREG